MEPGRHTRTLRFLFLSRGPMSNKLNSCVRWSSGRCSFRAAYSWARSSLTHSSPRGRREPWWAGAEVSEPSMAA